MRGSVLFWKKHNGAKKPLLCSVLWKAIILASLAHKITRWMQPWTEVSQCCVLIQQVWVWFSFFPTDSCCSVGGRDKKEITSDYPLFSWRCVAPVWQLLGRLQSALSCSSNSGLLSRWGIFPPPLCFGIVYIFSFLSSFHDREHCFGFSVDSLFQWEEQNAMLKNV